MAEKIVSNWEIKHHNSANEAYVPVKFVYGDISVDWWIPIEYRRTGVHLVDAGESKIKTYISEVYEICRPDQWEGFRAEQQEFWKSRRDGETKEFFDVLNSSFEWKSASDFPRNPNPARRFQRIKELGFTVATKISRQGPETQYLLVPVPRGGAAGYEYFTTEIRQRIIELLGSRDAYEGRVERTNVLVVDHKFPESRWDPVTRRESLDGMSDSELVNDFQLLTNQRNHHKREVCKRCVETGERGTPFGIEFFYEGSQFWNESIPKRGKDAEAGCVGCGWYDLEMWRSRLNQSLSEDS